MVNRIRNKYERLVQLSNTYATSFISLDELSKLIDEFTRDLAHIECLLATPSNLHTGILDHMSIEIDLNDVSRNNKNKQINKSSKIFTQYLIFFVVSCFGINRS